MLGLFSISMIMIALMMVSSVSWFFSWMMLELSTFFCIPFLLARQVSSILKVSVWKYFVVQSLGSSLFFLSMVLYNGGMMMNMSLMNTCSLITIMALMMKLGLPPFHVWLFEMSENLNWLKLLMINTIQKINPLALMWSFSNPKIFLVITSISVLWSMNCLFDYSIRRFFIYSSMLNLGWLVIAAESDKMNMMNFFLVYSLSMLCILLVFYEFNVNKFTDIFFFHKSFNYTFVLIFICNILSLCGFPPFLGFYMKVSILVSFAYSTSVVNFLVGFFTVFASATMMYMYMYSFLFVYFKKSKSSMMSLSYGLIYGMITSVHIMGPITF